MTTTTTTKTATAVTNTAVTTAIKEVEPVNKKYVRNMNPETPDITTVNSLIESYNDTIGKSREFRVLSSLLEKIIRLEQYDLKDYLYSVLLGFGYDVVYADGYLFAKGNIPVMLCAHMDTVHKKPVENIYMSDNGCIWSPQGIGGDDRCGIYTAIMSIRDGRKPYILFTEDEEIGCIGAGYFADDVFNGVIKEEDININFIIEIDRKGSNDSVYYSCDNPEFEKFIDGYGFKTAWGSCSDISDVAPALGVAAVNLSSGYYNAHTTDEYIVLDELYNIIDRVNTIIKDAADGKTVKYEYIESKYSYQGYASKGCYGWYGDYDYDYDEYDYGRYYGKDKKSDKQVNKKSGIDIEEDESLWDDMILASPVDETAYIISEDGNLIDPEYNELYYIDENNKVYRMVDVIDSEWDDDEEHVIVTPSTASVFTESSNHYQYHESDAEIVYVVKDMYQYA